jgi:hypothetical protein
MTTLWALAGSLIMRAERDQTTAPQMQTLLGLIAC